ncbi:uncharacterized protein LOC105208431 isoform X1 [Zeugodacus cucurbitae]|uniref:uncharacterized protein LOC105208431 isoform X1 n=1 Tax=Zeugodacus cucurbitae TaxID=28588 RepID=UPI0023D94484|nr:uncharacterized protein LOC105208431 isoform X1 [Zeugodacus cucurbitae]XP_054082091.1 uncharacterized protein LOC105208431 isoform X1 [Zeugodacus cucurbitae]XP_054082092.1 uncharacterized protein LOC105208431 isoform X1 [Zeugodacus cucurbitae]
MEEVKGPKNKKDSVFVSYIYCSCSMAINKRRTYDNCFNNICNPTNHLQIKKDNNLCKNISIATNWQYVLAFLLSSALVLGADSMMTQSRHTTIPSPEISKTRVAQHSATTQTTFPHETTTVQLISTVKYSLAPIIEDSVQTFYAPPTSTSTVALQSIPISLSSTVASTQHSSSPDALAKGFSIPTFLSPLPSFSIAELSEYSSPTTSSKILTSSKNTENQDQLNIDGYQQNNRRPNSSMTTKNITVQLGNHAYLPCNMPRMLNKPISWLRLRDGHILSVDQAAFISDRRFQSIFHGQSNNTCSLQIKYVQKSDEGWYECQVSTEPKMSAKMYLGVVVPHTELIGDRNRFVKTGSRVVLHCIVRDTLEPPAYIIWFRDKTQITNENELGWYTEIDRAIFGNVDSSRNTIGSLIIPYVRKQDSDTYTCEPSNSASVSVQLHVLSGEYSASAIMSVANSHRINKSIFTCHLFFLLFLAIRNA